MHILLLTVTFSNAQVFPSEGSKLNYRIIGFSIKQKQLCEIEIARGIINDAGLFGRNLVKSAKCSNGFCIAVVPSWNCDYTWRVKTDPAVLYHFSTEASTVVDTSVNRVRIVKGNTGAGLYFFVDVAEALFDVNGRAVWFLPDIPEIANKRGMIRDIKVTPQGTITFLANNTIFEIDWNGKILWKGPSTGEVSGETEEYYHHEFTRLANGHYMVLGAENPEWEVANYDDTFYLRVAGDVIHADDGKDYTKVQLGTLIEYDEHGKVVWKWKVSDYAKARHLYELLTFGVRKTYSGGHENSFFFDEKNKVIYLSFRNISKIAKIKYPEGNILAIYDNMDKQGRELYYGQHSVSAMDGKLLLHNNNAHADNSIPAVAILKEDGNDTVHLTKIWEFQGNANGLPRNENPEEHTGGNEQTRKIKMTAGGNIVPFGKNEFFISMSISHENRPFSKFFLVDKSKKILWEAVFESRVNANVSWSSKVNYKASAVSTNDLKSMLTHILR